MSHSLTIPGIQKQTPRSQGKAIVLMGKVMRGEEVKQRKKRAEETEPRERHEDGLRTDIINALRKKGCTVRRVEPCVRGDFSLGDLWVIYLPTLWAGFMEVKYGNNDLDDGQKEMKRKCEMCGVKYRKVNSVEVAIEALFLL